MTNKKEIINLLYIALGCFIFAIGINLFLTPAGVFSAGLFGFAQEISAILNSLFGTGDLTSIIYFLLNIPAVLLGWFKVGKKFTLRTFLAIFLISFFTAIIPKDVILVPDTLLAIITAGLFIGLGVGLTLRYGGSTGGTDIIALFFSLVKGKSFGVINIIVNSGVIILAMLLLQDFTTGIYMVIILFVSGVVIDKVHNANDKLTLFIITKNEKTVRETLLANHVRGLTIFDTVGGLSQEKSNTIMIVVSKGEFYSVIDTIKSADEKAFINVFKVDKLLGNFEDRYKEIL